MMILIVDIQNEKINIIKDKKLFVIDSNDIESAVKIVGDSELLYVTELVETTGHEVLQTLFDFDPAEIENLQIDETDRMYLHVTHPYKTYVDHNGRQYVFAGKHDAKALDDLPDDIIENCEQIMHGIKTGLFEIIDELQKAELDKEKEKSPLSRLKRSVAESKSKGSLDEPIEIDLGGSASFKRDK